MNRRGFLKGLIGAPVGAVAAVVGPVLKLVPELPYAEKFFQRAERQNWFALHHDACRDLTLQWRARVERLRQFHFGPRKGA